MAEIRSGSFGGGGGGGGGASKPLVTAQHERFGKTMLDDTGLVIVAGGSARRFGGGNKLLIEIAGMPLFLHTVRRFLPELAGRIVVVVPPAERETFRAAADRLLPDHRLIWAKGGAVRSESVKNGLAALPDGVAIAAIHDAARPLADLALLEKLVEQARVVGGAIPGKPVTDTLKRTAPDGLIRETVDRCDLWRVETPQVFRRAALEEACRRAGDREFTDDAGVMEAAGFPVAVVHNEAENLKLTYAGETEFLARLLEAEQQR